MNGNGMNWNWSIRKGERLRVRAVFMMPISASKDETLEWVTYALGAGSIALTNPLIDCSLEAVREPELSMEAGPTRSGAVRGGSGACGSEIVPKGRIIRVDATIVMPAAATSIEAMEWIREGLGCGCGIATSNPLVDHDLEAEEEPVLEDTGMVLEETVTRVANDASGADAVYARRSTMVWDRRGPAEVAAWKSGAEKLREMHAGETRA